MSQDVYKEENAYLEYVEKCIAKELETATEMLDKLRKQKITYDDAKRGEHFTKEALMDLYASRIRRLKQIVNSPYFGRMDFTPKDTKISQKLYVGKTTVSNPENQLAVIDWRSPISSMYYDSSVGNAKYIAPKGIMEGYISLKRQIIIEDAIIKSVLDTDLVTDDEILQNYLDVHADNKMKDIVASIQKEQNDIIRRPIGENVIVQGVAGSGKTSVALHRIAFLIYLLNNSGNQRKINSDQFLIIGPNNYFLDYISGVLPDLDVEMVNQTTIPDLLADLVNEKFTVQESTDELKEFYANGRISYESTIKNSPQFEEALDRYIQDIIEYYKNTDIVCYGKVVFSKDEIAELLKNVNGNYRAKIDFIQKRFIKKIKDDYDKYYDMLTEDLYQEARSLPKDSERRRLLYDETTLIGKEVKTGLAKAIKKHFELINKKLLLLYAGFINSIDRYMNIEGVEEFKKFTTKRLSKKILSRDDIAPILYLKSQLDDIKDYNGIIHVIVDEAQDLGLLEFKVLKKLIPNATFSIFGDLNQAIFSYRSVKDWESVKNAVFEGNANIIMMDQSYRTTDEIMSEANKISEFLTGTYSKDIIRHGKPVQYISCDEDSEVLFIAEKIKEYQNSGYQSIAIICKTEEEALIVNKKLSDYGINARNVTPNDREYHGGLCTITCSLAKGLEFDASILANVDSKMYNQFRDIDMKLLYVGMTRALHETTVISTGELPSVLKKRGETLVRKK